MRRFAEDGRHAYDFSGQGGLEQGPGRCLALKPKEARWPVGFGIDLDAAQAPSDALAEGLENRLLAGPETEKGGVTLHLGQRAQGVELGGCTDTACEALRIG